MNIIKFLTNIGRIYGEVILGIFLGVFLGSYFSVQNGLIVAAIGVLICASRILILDWYKKEFGDISVMYQLNKKISENEDMDFIREAILSESMLISKLYDLSNGTLRYNKIGDYINAAESAVENTKDNIKATAFINPSDWEEHGELHTYLEEQFRIIEERNIKVTRIFFLTEEEENDEKIMNILKKQFDKNIKVFIARRNLHDNSISPFAIFDDKMALIGINYNENKKISQGCKTINKVEIEKLKSQFDDVFYTKSKIFQPLTPEIPNLTTSNSDPLNFGSLATEPL